MSVGMEPSPFFAPQASHSPFRSEVPLELEAGFPLAPGCSESRQTFLQAADSAGSKRQRSRSASPNLDHPSSGSNAQPRAVSPTLQPVSTFEGGTPAVRDCKKLYADDHVFPTAFQLDGRNGMSSQVTNCTFDFPDVFAGIHPGISKLFALLQFNSRTPTTSRRTPRWYLRGNQWLVGFNKQDFELAENQQMFGTTLDTLYQTLTNRSKKDKDDKKPYLVNLCNYFSRSSDPKVKQMQATTMAFFWRQDFFPNCSLVHLRNVSIPIHHEEFCKVSMAPTILALDIPDWCSSVKCVNPTPPVAQSQDDDERWLLFNSDDDDTDSQNSDGIIGTHPESGESGFYCVECLKIGILSFISRSVEKRCVHYPLIQPFPDNK